MDLWLLQSGDGKRQFNEDLSQRRLLKHSLTYLPPQLRSDVKHRFNYWTSSASAQAIYIYYAFRNRTARLTFAMWYNHQNEKKKGRWGDGGVVRPSIKLGKEVLADSSATCQWLRACTETRGSLSARWRNTRPRYADYRGFPQRPPANGRCWRDSGQERGRKKQA